METMSFKIEGMACSCEASIVEKRVKKLAGVESYAFNPITNAMKLTFDPQLVSVQDIEKAVAKAGLKAILGK